MNAEVDATVSEQAEGIRRIPVRNLWLLLLYASDLGRYFGRIDVAVEEGPDLPSLVARLLAHAVERRLRRNLSRGYVRKGAILTQVRGRIDIIKTYTQDLLSLGMIAVRFDDHTIDTPRNRLVRAALDAVASRVTDPMLSHQCRTLAGDLGRLGVIGVRPSRAAISADRLSRHDVDDLLMITLAKIVFDLVLPSEEEGNRTLTRIERDERLLRKLFEKAVGNFYSAELSAHAGWRVYQGRWLYWPRDAASPGIDAVLPNMKTDIILDNPSHGRRIVIDTKFTSIFSSSAYREAVLKSNYIYQMYAYLRSQANGIDPLADNAEGILLHPAINTDVDESIVVQGHRIRFLTVDLTRSSADILEFLRSIPSSSPSPVMDF